MFAALRNAPPDRQTGIVINTRQSKYGFIQTPDYPSLFFHFSELSDEDKALVDIGHKVSFEIELNPNNPKNNRAVHVRIISTRSTFKDVEGVVSIDMRTNGFCLIDANNASYLFFSSDLVNDEACRVVGNTVCRGQRVKFDIKLNYKYSPPKPYAINVRVLIDGHVAPEVTNPRASALYANSDRPWVRIDAAGSLKHKERGVGASSLRALVDAVTRECDTPMGYLATRNRLQSPDYLNRSLSIHERRRLSALMEARRKPVTTWKPPRHRRASQTRCALSTSVYAPLFARECSS